HRAGPRAVGVAPTRRGDRRPRRAAGRALRARPDPGPDVRTGGMRTLLGLYIVRRVTLAIIGSFLGFMAVAYLVDLVELIRRAGERGNIGIVPLAYLGLLRAPALGEQILPFAVLFGAMISLLNLSRRMELVVLRAAGISAWQFLRPAILVAAGLGLLSALAYNPVAAALKERAEALERTLLSRSAAGLDAWL